MPSLVDEVLDQPGTHVLVIGVSAYRHFEDGETPTGQGELLGMGQLTGPARSASDIAAWFLDANGYRNTQAPLASLRVLLSPGEDEAINPALDGYADRIGTATLAEVDAAFNELRAASVGHVKNVIVVYVAGHGVQLSKDGAVVLLHDCGAHPAQILRGAVDMVGVYRSFDHPDTAQTQFWFVDACRQRPEVASRFESLSRALTYDEPAGRSAASNLFLSAITGRPAYVRPEGQTLFCEALLWVLSGKAAATPRANVSDYWHVSSGSLMDGLPARVKALAEAEGASQTVDCAVRSTVAFHEFESPPPVAITIALQPEAAAAGCVGSLRHDERGTIRDNVNQWPMLDTVEAGIYEVAVTPPGQPAPRTVLRAAEPPSAYWQIKVAP